MDFEVPAVYILKVKESEKLTIYLDVAREMNNWLNRMLTVKPVVVEDLRTISKKQEMRLVEYKIRGRRYINKTT